MASDEIRDDLLGISVDPPTILDLDQIRSRGVRKRRRRQMVAPALAAVVLTGLGWSVATRLDDSVLITDVPALSSTPDTNVVDPLPTTVPPQSTTTSVTDATSQVDENQPKPMNEGEPETLSPVPQDGQADSPVDPSDPAPSPVEVDDVQGQAEDSPLDDGDNDDSNSADADSTPELDKDDVDSANDANGPDLEPFVCNVDGTGTVRWTDHDQSTYWVYRSADGGASFEWVGRTNGPTVFVDGNHQSEYLYELRYTGLGFRAYCEQTGAFGCLVSSSGTITWAEHDGTSTSIYRSTDGDAYTMIGQRADGNAYTDISFNSRHRYRVDHPELGLRPDCVAVGGFACQVSSGGVVSWTDDDQAEYWVYRSSDDGGTYQFVSKTAGATNFTDENYEPGIEYQLDYQGLWPRADCIQSQ